MGPSSGLLFAVMVARVVAAVTEPGVQCREDVLRGLLFGDGWHRVGPRPPHQILANQILVCKELAGVLRSTAHQAMLVHAPAR